ncbi:EamA-like transporter family protein [Bacillus cereus]|uniref:EamA-like transporter family protein n=1 Tax=Bacillus paramycoides TaxID=2026194 RepID=A0A1J9VZA9_9BACI|nr:MULTISPECIES: DMT family transporter [Bacillus]PFD32801.1 EamA-like transporter family protein [Bacillus cereus]KMN42212.1 membrane protein [Bacillus sp. LK2]MED0963062.1 DMT family transporter [Bacillus paramycoides]MED0973395.1 DMT family transporter [Bacillus paramycoides]MED0978427.1 DMT family transporter [Bacillus paramycoides]
MLYICIAILVGVSIVVARIINANLATKIGIWEGTFFNYITGLFFSALFLIFSTDSLYISSHTLQSIPFAVYLGGLVGVIVIVLSNYITPKISAFYLTLLIFIGQLFMGTVIDFLLSNELSIGKIVGGILVLLGLTYNLLVDRPIKTVKNNHVQL